MAAEFIDRRQFIGADTRCLHDGRGGLTKARHVDGLLDHAVADEPVEILPHFLDTCGEIAD